VLVCVLVRVRSSCSCGARGARRARCAVRFVRRWYYSSARGDCQAGNRIPARARVRSCAGLDAARGSTVERAARERAARTTRAARARSCAGRSTLRGAGLRERERGRARVRSCAGSERGRGSTVERGRYRRTRASTRARIAASPRAGIAGGLVRFNRSGAGSCGARSIPARIAPPSSAGLLATIGGRSLALLGFVFVCSCVCYPRSCVWCVWRALRAPFHWSKPRPAEAGAGLW